MTSPSAFIPIDRREALAANQPLPDRAQGAALVADISGFTPLTEELSRAFGPERGAEELVSQLNQIYEAVIAEIDRFGGSVIGLSGDAVTCWFDADDGRRATASAFAIQKAMQQFAAVKIAGREAVAITVKVAAVTGPVRRFVVGDPDIQLIDVIAGATLNRLEAAELVAEKGEVVLDEPTWRTLEPFAQMRGWRTRDAARYAILSNLTASVAPQPWQPLPPDALTEAQVRPWVLPTVYERLSGGQSDFLAELRPAVGMFVNFSGIDYDTDAQAGVKLDTFIRRVQQVVARYEGALIAVTFGDKGSYLHIAFGAPVAHDDDPERALAAALELSALPDTLDFINPVRIGISRGHMRTGAYGSANRLSYGVQGDEVNLAARLMQRAEPRQILVSERIPAVVGELYRFAPLGEIRVKGKQNPVKLFTVIARAERKTLPSDATEMVGRAAERALLSEKLRALRGSKQSCVILIEGEAGIGKSRLVENLRWEAQVASVTSLTGAGDATERSTPYHAWRPVLAQLFKLDAFPDDKAARRQHVLTEVEAAVGPELVRFTPLLNAVLPLDFPDNELTAQMSGQVRADNTQLLLTRLLQHLAGAWSLLLVLEDAHWFDSASWALARRVAQEVDPIMQVIATRPLAEPYPSEYRNLLNDPGTVRLQLAPLPIEDVQALVSKRLGVTSLPAPVTALLSEKAEGNPFFSEELAYALRDSGLLVITGDQCQLAPNVDLKAVTFPDTVQEVVTSRIDRLSATQQLTLKVASVVGRLFALRILRDTFPVESERPLLQDQLEILSRLDFTIPEVPEPEAAYSFKHAITQDVSYGLLLFAQRRELHQQIAEWYERNYADNLSPYYPLLAHHWDKAEAPARAIDYLEKSGDQAMRNFANAEAVAFLERALQLAADLTPPLPAARRARWEMQVGEAYVNLSRYVEGRKHLGAGLALAGRPVPARMGAQVVSVLTQVLLQVEHRALSRRYTARSAASNDDALAVIRAYESLTEATYFLGETLLSVYAAFRGLNLGEVAGPSPELGRTTAVVGALLGFIALHSVAEGYLTRALAMEGQFDQLESRAYVSTTASYYYSGVGNWQGAAQQSSQVLEIANRLGDTRRWQDATSHVMSVRQLQGDFAGCIQLADELYATASHRSDARFMALALEAKAYCDLYSGRLDRATTSLQTLKTLIGDGTEVSVLPIKMELLGLSAVTYLRGGDFASALDAAQQVLALTGKATPSFYAALTGYTGPAEVYLSLWEHKHPTPDLPKSAAHAIQTLGKYARVFPVGQPRFHLAQGRYAWLSGKPADAQKSWNTSLALAEKLSMVYDQALAHYELARHSPASDSARQHRECAIELFGRIGAAYDLERAREI